MVFVPAGLPPSIVGRDAELRRIDAFVGRLADDASSLVLVGDAGIGKTTLWTHGVQRSREAGAQVLVTRPTDEDRHSPAQGLLDLFDPAHLPDGFPAGRVTDPDLPVLDRSRHVLERLRALAALTPVVVAVDDLPWLDDVTARTLRFALRRLVGAPVSLLATARTWSPDELGLGVPDLGRGVELLEVTGLGRSELRRVVLGAVPSATVPIAVQAGDQAHGNPLFAIELARTLAGGGGRAQHSPLASLARRVGVLPPDTLHLLRLLAVAGPSSLGDLARAMGGGTVDDALRPALDADVVTLDPAFDLRFTHPLIATAVLGGMNTLDRRNVHAELARVVADDDARAVHLARAVAEPDGAVAQAVESAALRLARRGAPRLAADLLADSARLTPREDVRGYVRRTLAQMMQRTAAGDLPTAVRLAGALLEQLEPGPLRAEVVTGRVVADFTDAERVLRDALDEVPGDCQVTHECLRGRLLGLLGWLLAVYLGRPREGLELARAGLEIGRSHDDAVLVAQSASVVSTASILLGVRADALMEEAVALGPRVVTSQLALWPQVLQGRQQLWDGRLADARVTSESMYRRVVANGSEFHRAYRLVDLAQVALAAGDLDLAAQHVDDGMEAAGDCHDERGISWLAYPAGLVAALRGDASGADRWADRLDWWADRVDERPRHAMARHVRGVLAAARQDWESGLEHLLTGLSMLDAMGYVHPGAVPVLPQAVQLASAAGLTDQVEPLVGRLRGASPALRSPWVDAQLRAATGQLLLLHGDPDAWSDLAGARDALTTLGYRLDAARTGCFAVAAGLRNGQRRVTRDIAEDTVQMLTRNGVAGWDHYARELLDRVRGATDDGLTSTETEIAALVAAGRRNREIAARLFISESTVEAHLTRVYRKLGLRNRAELSRRVARDA